MRDTLDVLGIIACGAVDVVAIAGDEAGVGEVAQVEATEEAGALAEDSGGGSQTTITKLPKNPDDLVSKHGFDETTHPKEQAVGRRVFKNAKTGDVVEFDKGVPGEPGFKGKNHYHIRNPNSKNKMDKYLDKDNNPVPDGSKRSHILPEEE